jgi:F-type H+-transporting ATPase subunit b
VADAIAGRQKAAVQLLDDAKAAKAAAQNERDKAAAEAARLAEHRGEAYKAVEAEAAGAKSTLLAKARAEADRLLAASKVEIENRRLSEARATDDRAAQLAVDLANKLLDRLPGEARVSGFLDGIATGLTKLPEETRASIGSEDQPIRLTAARPVTPEEEGACRRTLASVFGHPVTIEISVDPTLIAGIELEGPQAIVRNSFRADLILLKSKLVHHDTSNA